MGRLFYFDEEEEVTTCHISYIITGLIVVFSMIAITAFAKSDQPIDTEVQSEAGIVMDMDPGAVLFTQNIRGREILADVTKLLTVFVVTENINNLDVPVTFSHDTVYNVESGVGNKFNLEEEGVLSVRQHLYATLLQSSNQPANALTEYVVGGRQALADMVSQRIEELGCNESHFVNSSGPNDDTQRTTTYDMAIIARACFQNPTVLEIASARTSSIPTTANGPDGRTSSVKHRMLLSDDSNYYPDAIAGKAGWTSQAGQTLATYTRWKGRGQIVATLTNTQKARYSDTKTTLDFCFAKFKNANIADNETEYVTGSAPVTIEAEAHDPSRLSIGNGAVTTIPSNAQLTGANKTLEADLLEGHPQEAATRLVYTCSERRVGDAWICNSSAQAVNVTPFEPGGDAPPESRPTKDGQEGNTGFMFPRAVLIGGGTVLVLAPLAGGGVFWLERRQTAERKRQRILGEERRQHLAGTGYTEEDLERLLDERRKQHDTR